MNYEHTHKVVARYANGKILKGYTFNFSPNRTRFHLFRTVTADRGTLILMKDLKAVFFVRDFAGDPDHSEPTAFDGAPRPAAHKVRVEFFDGELLCGYTTMADLHELGFFFVPVDPESNNVRVFAALAAVSSVRLDSNLVWSNSPSTVAQGLRFSLPDSL